MDGAGVDAPDLRCQVLAVYAWCESIGGELGEVERSLEVAARDRRRASPTDPELASAAARARCLALLRQGRFAEAVAPGAAQRANCRCPTGRPDLRLHRAGQRGVRARGRRRPRRGAGPAGPHAGRAARARHARDRGPGARSTAHGCWSGCDRLADAGEAAAAGAPDRRASRRARPAGARRRRARPDRAARRRLCGGARTAHRRAAVTRCRDRAAAGPAAARRGARAARRAWTRPRPSCWTWRLEPVAARRLAGHAGGPDGGGRGPDRGRPWRPADSPGDGSARPRRAGSAASTRPNWAGASPTSWSTSAARSSGSSCPPRNWRPSTPTCDALSTEESAMPSSTMHHDGRERARRVEDPLRPAALPAVVDGRGHGGRRRRAGRRRGHHHVPGGLSRLPDAAAGRRVLAGAPRRRVVHRVGPGVRLAACSRWIPGTRITVHVAIPEREAARLATQRDVVSSSLRRLAALAEAVCYGARLEDQVERRARRGAEAGEAAVADGRLDRAGPACAPRQAPPSCDARGRHADQRRGGVEDPSDRVEVVRDRVARRWARRSATCRRRRATARTCCAAPPDRPCRAGSRTSRPGRIRSPGSRRHPRPRSAPDRPRPPRPPVRGPGRSDASW